MTATNKPSLREVLIDSLDIAYWVSRDEIEQCGACARNPAGVALCHRDDNDAAYIYEEYRKQLQRTPGHPEVLAVLASLGGAS